MMKVTATIRKDFCLKLSGATLLALLNGDTDLEIPGEPALARIPKDAKVRFSVPGGGDYANCDLDVEDGSPITITWSETSERDL